MQFGIELDASGPGSVRRELRGIAADDTLLHVNCWDLSARYLGSSRLNGTAEHAGPHVRSTLDQCRILSPPALPPPPVCPLLMCRRAMFCLAHL